MLRWIAILSALAVVAGSAFFILYHPPMRLMPPPLLFQRGGERIFDVAPDLVQGSEIEIFFATSRLPVGPADRRVYTVAPDRSLRLGTATLRIGEGDATLAQIREWTTGLGSGDRPFLHLVAMQETARLAPGEVPVAGSAAGDWFAALDDALAKTRDRDVLIYVHGANTTVERAAGQASQLRHFSGRNAVVVLFTWPTAENFLRYGRDIRNAFASAPHLAQLIGLMQRHSASERVNVFTYSAGATVGSKALAILVEEDPEAATDLGEVYHAAPDADFRDFVADLKVYGSAARRVTAAVNLGDSALRLAQVMNRASRAGRPDLRELEPEAAEWLLAAAGTDGIDLLQIHPEAMPELDARSHTFWYDDPWVSNDALLTLLLHLPPEKRALEPGVSPSGAPYWTFPPDYPERLRARAESLRQR
ncbi:MAG: alpha/beta hydrolase [Sedimentitalea sp.]|nr:alpha/beta hydrolase [Sedimentitalea sp.]